jgi:hypothetical protein
VLAGRDTVLEAAAEALDVAALDGRTPPPLVLVGPRGVGKTVLLGEIAALAAGRHSWPTAAVEVRPGTPFTAQLLTRLEAITDAIAETPRGRRFQLERVTVRGGVPGLSAEATGSRTPPDEPVVDGLALERSLGRAAAVTVDRGCGLLLTIDEVQLAGRPELADLAATLQQHVPDDWPLVVVFAGLPAIRDSDRSVTYLERAEWHDLGMLGPDAARVALTEPAARAGRPIDAHAADLLVRASGGYPYAVQLFGHHAWRASAGAATITLEHARQGARAAEQALASSLYAGRWHDAAPKEKEYLLAVAQLAADTGETTGGAVAAHLGVTAKEVSYLRARLLKKGTLSASGYTLRFPVPGMASWILAPHD